MPAPGASGAVRFPPHTRFFLVIPAYREAKRLPAFLHDLRAALAGVSGGVCVQIVDDGSPREDWEMLRVALAAGAIGATSSADHACRVLPPLRLEQNTRKGGAILSAWLDAPVADWLAFLDADGAIPAGEVRRVLDEIGPEDTGAFFASRAVGGPRPRQTRRTLARRLTSAAFAFLARKLLGVGIRDSQCGLKLLRASDFGRIVAGLKPHGFCFDLALWLALRRAGVAVREVPVRWIEKPGGHLSPLRHGPGILRELFALRREHRPAADLRDGDRAHSALFVSP